MRSPIIGLGADRVLWHDTSPAPTDACRLTRRTSAPNAEPTIQPDESSRVTKMPSSMVFFVTRRRPQHILAPRKADQGQARKSTTLTAIYCRLKARMQVSGPSSDSRTFRKTACSYPPSLAALRSSEHSFPDNAGSCVASRAIAPALHKQPTDLDTLLIGRVNTLPARFGLAHEPSKVHRTLPHQPFLDEIGRAHV